MPNPAAGQSTAGCAGTRHGHCRPRRRLRGRAYRRLVSVGLLAFLLPHLYVVARGREWYPLTCAGMFAYYVDQDTPRYVFRMTGAFAGEDAPVEMRFSDARANARNFFAHVYGSASSNTTHHHFPNDTPEQFAERTGHWFGGYFRTWRALHPDAAPPSEITLWVQQINPELGEPLAVLRYDTAVDAVTVRPNNAAWVEPAAKTSTDGTSGAGDTP